MEGKKSCRHNFEESQNKLICTFCGRGKLILTRSPTIEGARVGTKSDGKKYTVRDDRHRYFFPDEWLLFIASLKSKRHVIFFKTLLYTGTRGMEALHIRPKDFDWDRETVKLDVVKGRASKRSYSTGKQRTFFVSKKYLKAMSTFIRDNKIGDDEYIFLDNERLPENYSELSNKEKSRYYSGKMTLYSHIMKGHLKKIGIKDWQNFSLHNIRKTYGNWMRIFNSVDQSELCYRMGNDINTYIAHYGSSMIFNDKERRQISGIFGDVK